MTAAGITGILLFLAVLLALAVPFGRYMFRAMEGQLHWLGWLERPLLALAGPAAKGEQDWRTYFRSMLVLSLVGMLFTYGVLRLQAYLPLRQAALPPQGPQLAFNTAASFIANTNWQAYAGETLTYLSQITLMVLQFISPAIGLVFAIAFTRGLVAKRDTLGDFYADLVRALIYIFLPLAFIGAVALAALGVPDSFAGPAIVHTLSGAVQVIARGPVAAFEAIKMVGTNGGGFFNANSAHPFEGPNVASTLLECLMMSILPTALVFTFGHYANSRRQAWVLAGVTLLLYMVGIGTVYAAEASGNPVLHHALGIAGQPNWEGKEVRFGIADSSLFVATTTAFTTGAVNTMHDSLTPLGGLVPLLFMMLNLVFGGKGAGLLNILMMVIITVFVAGLMVGRTPEFLGKKIEAREIKLAVIAMLIHPLIILAPTAFALVHKIGTSSIANPGFHGISEVIYAFTSGAANNGSAFAGLNANTPFYNISIGLVILVGRYLSVAAMLAMAGSLGAKKIIPASAGTLATDSWSFGFVYLGVVMIVAALTFFPALSLGPIAEQVLMAARGVYR
jgi:K+-transporting ATPase ATPase A chain